MLLPRPLSISDIDKDHVVLVYALVGKGTRYFSGLKPDDHVRILGPLGNGFDLKQKPQNILLVGGGLGVAPLLFTARKLREMSGNGSNDSRKEVIADNSQGFGTKIAANSSNDPEKEIAANGSNDSGKEVIADSRQDPGTKIVANSSNDPEKEIAANNSNSSENEMIINRSNGSETNKIEQSNIIAILGYQKEIWYNKEMEACCDMTKTISENSGSKRGLVTDLLNRDEISSLPPEATMILCCGPRPMLKAVYDWGDAHGIPLQLSMEARMGCGVGICHGCTCHLQNAGGQTYRAKLCKYGPVIKGSDINW